MGSNHAKDQCLLKESIAMLALLDVLSSSYLAELRQANANRCRTSVASTLHQCELTLRHTMLVLLHSLNFNMRRQVVTL